MSTPVVYLEDPEGFLRRWTAPIAFKRTNELHLFLLDLVEQGACPEEFYERAKAILSAIVHDHA